MVAMMQASSPTARIRRKYAARSGVRSDSVKPAPPPRTTAAISAATPPIAMP